MTIQALQDLVVIAAPAALRHDGVVDFLVAAQAS